jgi:TRAP transporter 4TM/12TM fusion protein
MTINKKSHLKLKGIKSENKLRVQGLSYFIIIFIAAIGILITINQLFHLRIAGFMPIGNAYYYYILGTFLSITFLLFPAREKDKNLLPWFDWCIFIISIVINLYLAFNAYNILTKGWEYEAPLIPTIASFTLWLLALEAVRRAAGNILFIICFIISFYPIYGGFLPSILWGSPFTLTQTACYHAMGVESIIGIPTRVVANTLIGFMIFGAALVSSGGGKFFMDFATSTLGHTRGGAAKVSVIASALMASISGSVISNIVTTGTVTIPAMKKTGYTSRYAGAIEACASTGGTITPPIMGAAGFLIASFLNVAYVYVIIAAVFPAVLYYLTLILQVDNHAAKEKIVGLPREELPSLLETLKEGWYFLGSLVLLIFILTYVRMESWAPFYTIVFLFACAMIKKSTRYTWKRFGDFLFDSGKLLGQITSILAGVGLIVGALSGTGLANSFSRELVVLAGGNVFLLLSFGAITSFILGIGMTVTACYVFLAIVLVPALVEVGLNPMACHLFVLYWGVLSYITPPVALGSITAATIAGSNPMSTGWLSMRLGSAKYIVPFFFALNPALIFIGNAWEIMLATTTAAIGCVFLAASLEGWLYFYGKISTYQRVSSFIAGVLLMYPHWYSTIIGSAIVFLFIVIILLKRRSTYSFQNIDSR